MKLLLDTHIWVRSVIEPRLLSRPAARALANPNNEVWVSPVSGLEIISLCEKGRYRKISDPAKWIDETLRTVPIREAPLTFEIAIECGLITLPHDDPADRIIVATARVLGCKLVTSDKLIIESGLVEVLGEG